MLVSSVINGLVMSGGGGATDGNSLPKVCVAGWKVWEGAGGIYSFTVSNILFLVSFLPAELKGLVACSSGLV